MRPGERFWELLDLEARDSEELLRPVVGKWGAAAVAVAALEELGFPESWIRDESEVQKVTNRLQLQGVSTMRLSSGGAKSIDDLGFQSPLPGKYHVKVKSVDESLEKWQSVIVEFEVLAGTTPGQAGRTHREFFSVAENALDRLRRFAVASGIYRLEEGERDVVFREAIGRQLVVTIDDHEYQGKKRRQIPFVALWSVDHKDVADVPKDAEALAAHKAGKLLANASAETAGGGGSQAEVAPPAGTHALPGAGDGWASL